MAFGQTNGNQGQRRDLAVTEGSRENRLFGDGIVVGLAGTGDRRQTEFSGQLLSNLQLKLGTAIPAVTVGRKSVAAVFVTVPLSPYARPGAQLDVTVSSIGDAISLEGGTLLLVPLYGSDGEIYAEAQGIVASGENATGRGEKSHAATWRILRGGLVERECPDRLGPVSTPSVSASKKD